MRELISMTCSRCGSALERTERYNEYECTSCGTIFVITDTGTGPSLMDQGEMWLDLGEWVKAGQAFWQVIQSNPINGNAWFGLFRALSEDFDVDAIGEWVNYATYKTCYAHDLVEMGVFKDEYCWANYGDNPFVVLLRRAMDLDVFDDEQIDALANYFYEILDKYLGMVQHPYDLFRNEFQWAESLKCYYILTGEDPEVLVTFGYEYACDEKMMDYLDSHLYREPQEQW